MHCLLRDLALSWTCSKGGEQVCKPVLSPILSIFWEAETALTVLAHECARQPYIMAEGSIPSPELWEASCVGMVACTHSKLCHRMPVASGCLIALKLPCNANSDTQQVEAPPTVSRVVSRTLIA